jgi:hypothetical protein
VALAAALALPALVAAPVTLTHQQSLLKNSQKLLLLKHILSTIVDARRLIVEFSTLRGHFGYKF